MVITMAAASSLPVAFSWPATVHLPAIKCSFPTEQHPDYDARLVEAEAWVLSRFGGLDTASRKSFRQALLRKSSFHLLTSLAYANSLTERMGPIYQFIAWLFLFDNFLDDPAELGASPQDAAALLSQVEAVLDDADVELSSADVASTGLCDRLDRSARVNVACVFERTAREWWNSTRRLGMPPAQQARFARLFKAYLGANLLQVEKRRDGDLPGPAAYLHLRNDTGAVHVCCVLLEFGVAIDFDPATVNHSLMRRLGVAAAAHVDLTNDLYSFPKEYREGDLFNMVAVLFLDKKKKLQLELEQQRQQQDEQLLHKALAQVAELIQEKDAECVRLMDSIRQCPALMDQPGMALYLDGIGNFIAGNVQWHLVSLRYGISSCSLAASLNISNRPDNTTHSVC